MASTRPHECSPTWRHGSAEGSERTSGGNGKTAPTASKNCDSVACQSSTRRLLPLADWFLAHVRTSGRPTGAAQPVFRQSRSSPPLRSCPRLTRSNRRGTDPYARWCGRGGAARCLPIPIFGAYRPITRESQFGRRWQSKKSDQIEILLRISLGRRNLEAGVCRDAVLPGMRRGVLD